MPLLPQAAAQAAAALPDARALSLVGAAMQCVLALVHVGVLALARRRQRLRGGRDFVVAQAGLAVATLAIVVRNAHGAQPVAGEANVLLHLLAGTYLAGKLLFFLALASGTAQVLGHPPARRTRTAAVAAIAVAGVAYAALTPVLGVAYRVQGIAGLVVMAGGAWALARADRSVRTTGMALLAAALSLYALLSLPYLLGLRYAHLPGGASLGRAALEVLDLSSLADLLGQFLLGIALVALLLEQQREVAVRDATQRDALHREGQATARLETLGRVAASVAHELNNPLTVVLGTAEHMLARTHDPEQRDDLQLVLREALRCRHVARDLLLYAREQAPVREPLDASAVLAEAADAVRLQAAAAGVRLELSGAERTVLRGDAVALGQVLINLLRNAIEVAPPGTPVRAGTRRDGDAVLFSVEDLGPGIPADVRAHLFEPFFTTKPAGKGTGLGLPIVHGIVARHGGTLAVESLPERPVGTRFLVRVPTGGASSGEYPAVRAPVATPVPEPEARGRWVLVVDDEDGVRRVLSRFIERRGLRVEPTADGVAAQEALRGAPLATLDAIFCDVRMPRMDGLAFAAWLADTHPPLVARLVLLTGDTVSDDVGAAARRIGCRLMAKPFRKEEIDEVLGAAV